MQRCVAAFTCGALPPCTRQTLAPHWTRPGRCWFFLLTVARVGAYSLVHGRRSRLDGRAERVRDDLRFHDLWAGQVGWRF
jgi:hypothetical protein